MIRKHWYMAYKFMDDIRLWSIIWIFDISQVLCATEYLKSKSIEELALAEYSMGWFYGKACPALKISINIFKLWYLPLDIELFIELPTLF